MTLHAHLHRRTYTQAARTSRLAVASLVLGILSILSWILTMQGFSFALGGLIAVVGPTLALGFGYTAKGRIGRAEGTLRGRGLAIAIVLGWIGVGAFVLLVTVLVILGVASGGFGGSWGSLT